MGTSLDTGQRASGPPSVKLRNVGDYLNFMVVDIDNNVPKTKYGTDEPEISPKTGKQKMAARVTVIALGGNAARKDGEVDVPVQQDEVVSIFIDSYAKWDPDRDKETPAEGHVSWGKAIDRDLGGAENFKVGVVGQYAFLQLLPSANPDQPRKDRKFKLRPYAPDEQALHDRAEALHHEMKLGNATQLPTEPAQQPVPANLGSF